MAVEREREQSVGGGSVFFFSFVQFSVQHIFPIFRVFFLSAKYMVNWCFKLYLRDSLMKFFMVLWSPWEFFQQCQAASAYDLIEDEAPWQPLRR